MSSLNFEEVNERAGEVIEDILTYYDVEYKNFRVG